MTDDTAAPVVGLNLKQVAHRLDVHYMTAYRYVRQGQLRARQQGRTWRVLEEDLDLFTAIRQSDQDVPPVCGRMPWPDRTSRLGDRLVVGDEPGSWAIVEEALASGTTPEACFVDLIGAALASLAQKDDPLQEPADSTERCIASAVAHRLIVRLGARFRPRGHTIGRVVVGAATGARQPLRLALAAELLRLRRFVVLELGSDVPPESFVTAAHRADRLVAVGVGLGSPTCVEAAADICRLLYDELPGTAVIVYGWDIVEVPEFVGADGWVNNERSLVSKMETLVHLD